MDINKRWLLWLDMLGFKNWLERNDDNSNAIDRLEGALNYAFKLESGICSDFQSIQLSDTIIITTPGDSLEEFCKLSVISSFLMAALLEVDLPIRGVVSHGNSICRLSTNRISLPGNSIVEAAT